MNKAKFYLAHREYKTMTKALRYLAGRKVVILPSEETSSRALVRNPTRGASGVHIVAEGVGYIYSLKRKKNSRVTPNLANE
jgi:hypothetical protein